MDMTGIRAPNDMVSLAPIQPVPRIAQSPDDMRHAILDDPPGRPLNRQNGFDRIQMAMEFHHAAPLENGYRFLKFLPRENICPPIRSEAVILSNTHM
jgi:hypothetical protein